MDLIKRLYENSNIEFESNEKTYICFNDSDDVVRMTKFLKCVRCFDTDLLFEEFDNNIVKLFSKLGFGLASVFLHNMVVRNSKYNAKQEGSCIFSYSVDKLESNDGDTLGYYSSNELFDGVFSMYPGVKLSSGDTSLYYTVGTGPYIRKYTIKINEEVTLTREYSKNEVLFIFEEFGRRFVIKVIKPTSKVVTENYVLDNELMLVEYLKSLSSSFDMVEIYKKMCEISLGSDVSKYPEITLFGSSKTEDGWKDIGLISIKYGDVDSIIRTIGDKVITWYGTGNWTYVLSDENVTFRINSGKTLKYGIETKTDKAMDDYTDSLLKYDVSTARSEVEDTKRLVREKFGLSVKRKG